MRQAHTTKRQQEAQSERVEFAYWFKAMRTAAGLTIQQTADELGISATTICSYESGNHSRINNKEKVIRNMQTLVKKEIKRKREKHERY